jgi:hypothetical protein
MLVRAVRLWHALGLGRSAFVVETFFVFTAQMIEAGGEESLG